MDTTSSQDLNPLSSDNQVIQDDHKYDVNHPRDNHIRVYLIILVIEITIIVGFQIYIYLKRKSQENNLNDSTNNSKEVINDKNNPAFSKIKLSNELQKNSSDYIKIINQEEIDLVEMREREKKLSFNYLVIYSLARSVMWLKAPYVVVNFIRLGYSIPQISVLYFLDLVCAFIFGPLLGNYGDVYGRRNLSASYFLFTAIDLGLKIYGNTVGIYFSVLLNGVTTVLIHNAFESWVNYESKVLIEDYDERMVFLKNLFKDSNIYDSLCSLSCSVISLLLYVSDLIYKIIYNKMLNNKI